MTLGLRLLKLTSLLRDILSKFFLSRAPECFYQQYLENSELDLLSPNPRQLEEPSLGRPSHTEPRYCIQEIPVSSKVKMGARSLN